MGPFELLMRVTENALGAEGGAFVGQSLTSLTGLQELYLYSERLYVWWWFL